MAARSTWQARVSRVGSVCSASSRPAGRTSG
ncbi:Uncharacterised protein [Bordetella pertussis]|nr:Uncharacterised protein [Bordetella pertussis]